MRKLTLVLTAVSVVLSCGEAAAVNISRYTFSGNVTSVDDSAGIIASQFGPTFGVGSPVSHTFLLDYDAHATKTKNDGSVHTFNWSQYNQYYGYSVTTQYRYADLLSGDILHEVGGGSHNALSDIAEYNFHSFSDVSSPGPNDSMQFLGGSDDAKTTISLRDISSWSLIVGTAGFSGSTSACNSAGQVSQINFSSTITAVDKPGADQNFPVMPDNAEPDADGSWSFAGVGGDGCWFDPPMATGYRYETDGLSNFTDVTLPTGILDDDNLYMVKDGINPSVPVAGGDSYSFPVAVSEFTITGIEPMVDGGDALAFPTFLAFDETTVSFTMTPIPEPSALLLLGTGILGFLACLQRNRSARLR